MTHINRILMKKISLLVFLLLITSATVSPAAETEAPGADPAAVDKTFAEITAATPGAGPAAYVIKENDFNAWLKLKAGEKQFINEVKANFDADNEAGLSLRMDISKYPDQGYYAKMLATMFEGEQHLKVSGKIKSGNGKFSFVVNALTINEVIVTPALIYPLVKIILPEYDLDKPLDLPHGLTDVKTEKGILKLIR